MPGRLTSALCAPLLCWYAENRRTLPWRETHNAYHVWVSEIMLQQTRVEAVRGYFTRFIHALPTVRALAQADEQTYLKLWEGLGYYSRVRNLHLAAVRICEEFGGSLPTTYEELLSLPGIGDYTAGAVASIAFGQRVPAVDGNVLRVAARLTADESPITNPKTRAALRAQIAEILPPDSGSFNQALMELGALICIPKGAPRCGDCPLRHLCAGAETGVAARLPVRAAKKPRTIAHRTVLLLRHKNLIALQKRPKSGLLASMWELPGIEETVSPIVIRDVLAEQGYTVAQLHSLHPAKHIFTHVEWHMTGYCADLSALPAKSALIWVTAAQLRDEYALPSAFRAFLSVLEDY